MARGSEMRGFLSISKILAPFNSPTVPSGVEWDAREKISCSSSTHFQRKWGKGQKNKLARDS